MRISPVLVMNQVENSVVMEMTDGRLADDDRTSC
jgi:hypothetical protein